MEIVLIATGGTIAMSRKPDDSGSSLCSDATHFTKSLSVDENDRIRGIDFSHLPGSNLNSNFAQKLATGIEEISKSVNAVIITHGTDTMEETAFYLELVSAHNIPIILTGAMMTENQPGFDGIANLRDAITVAKAPGTMGMGVLIVFNRDILLATHASKVESERPNAFGNLKTGKIGSVNRESAIYYYKTRKHIKLANKTKGKVSLLKMHYDIQSEIVEHAFRTTDIIVFEAYGSGRLPPTVLPYIKAKSDKIIILTTRVPTGHLYDDYCYEGSYHDLQNRGLIISPLDALKSCILARLCLGNQKSPEETKEIFENFFNHTPNI